MFTCSSCAENLICLQRQEVQISLTFMDILTFFRVPSFEVLHQRFQATSPMYLLAYETLSYHKWQKVPSNRNALSTARKVQRGEK